MAPSLDSVAWVDEREAIPTPANNPGTVSPATLHRLALLTRRLKHRVTSLLKLAAGHRVLDVGCGPGIDTRAMLDDVQPGGQIVGIDYDVEMIHGAVARARTAGRGCRLWHVCADAAAIPFPTGFFDACRCERLLQHSTDPPAVLREIIRVTKPGGQIVVADTDWATLSIDTPEVDTERAFVRFIAESLCNGYAGRQLWRLFNDEGLTGAAVEISPIAWTDYASFCATSLSLANLDQRAVAAGAVSAAAMDRLRQSLVDADRRGAFFASGGVVLAHARAPLSRKMRRRRPDDADPSLAIKSHDGG